MTEHHKSEPSATNTLSQSSVVPEAAVEPRVLTIDEVRAVAGGPVIENGGNPP